MHVNKKESTFLDGMCSIIQIRIMLILLALAVFAVCYIMLVCETSITYTETADLNEYGNIHGTNSDSFVHDYIFSFFPQEIDESFSNVQYSYKAEDLDTYGFEAYLEFQIEDTNQFNRYIAMFDDESKWNSFSFDNRYMEYSLENVFVLDTDDADDPDSLSYIQIVDARIRKVLVDFESQTLVFVAMGVYDGGGIGTNFLCHFFNHFQIDPAEYAKLADSSYNVNPYGIK